MSAFTDAVLARNCAGACADIDSILMVGALSRCDSTVDLSDNDDRYLAAIFEEGARLGLRFARQVRVIASNIVYQSNFVRDEMRAPLVAFCMIYYNPGGTEQGAIDKRYYRQHPENFVDGAWHRALMRSGAGWAVNVHAEDRELPTDFIARDPYSVVHSTPLGQNRRMDFVRRLAA